jgi:hypothetical protein
VIGVEQRVCPGCGGKKSKRAELCASCRKRANVVGASVITHVAEAAISPESAPARPRTPQQNTVYHGKISDLAKLNAPGLEKAELRLAERNVKTRALQHARKMFSRPIDSSTELTEIEMERLLEWLDVELDRANQEATMQPQRNS